MHNTFIIIWHNIFYGVFFPLNSKVVVINDIFDVFPLYFNVFVPVCSSVLMIQADSMPEFMYDCW